MYENNEQKGCISQKELIIMVENILNAFERSTGHKKFKESGFIAGVIYGDGVNKSESVKFEEVPLRKILMNHGSNAKIWIKSGQDKKYGFIKEIQRHPVTAKIIHVDVQLVSSDHEIKLLLPIVFKGEEALTANLLQFQVYKSEIDVTGKMALLPDSVTIDLSENILGDSITIKDFALDKQIKINDKPDEVYAVITALQELPEDDDDTDADTTEEVTV